MVVAFMCANHHSGSFPPPLSPPPVLQIKMNVPSSPLCAPLTALFAQTPTAALNAAPREDALKALSPTMMGLHVWVSDRGVVDLGHVSE